MSAAEQFTLSKQERICSKRLIDQLFSGNGQTMTAFPIRVVFMKRQLAPGEPQAAMLVSVPKRFFKRAVKRNKIKRQLREAYRRNKSILTRTLQHDDEGVAVAFIWLADRLFTTEEVENRMVRLMTRISECL